MYRPYSSNTSAPASANTLLAQDLAQTIAQVLPKPIKWTCCRCDHSYNLGTTSKCLKCSHQFCHNILKASTPTPTSTSASTIKALAPAPERKPRSCELDFDDRGWEIYNQWRHDLLKPKPKTLTIIEEETTPPPLSRNCYFQCKYPSECKILLNHEPRQPHSTLKRPGREGISAEIIVDKEGISLGLRNIFDQEGEEGWYSAGF